MKRYGYLLYQGAERRVEIIDEAKDSYSFIPPAAGKGVIGVVGKKFVRLEGDTRNGFPKPEPSRPDKRRDPPLPRPA